MKRSVLDLYKKTNGGLNIIYYYYPQARECVEGSAKFFKIRPDELRPTAIIVCYDCIWNIIDFGDSVRCLSPIDICMQENNLSYDDAITFVVNKLLTNPGIAEAGEDIKDHMKECVKHRSDLANWNLRHHRKYYVESLSKVEDILLDRLSDQEEDNRGETVSILADIRNIHKALKNLSDKYEEDYEL
ncbi:MAG TPA: hypothetical protein DEQ30_04880 [Porphyromonadaceae bacterium]|nr:hypothetical protein [Porphyromonadaceae bacterium]